MNEQQVRFYIQKIQEGIEKAANAGQLDHVEELAQAEQMLSEWKDDGMMGEMPVNLQELLLLLGKEIDQYGKDLESSSGLEGDLSELLNGARKKNADGRYQEAISDLQAIIRSAEGDFAKEAEAELSSVWKNYRKRKEQLLKEARRIDEEHPENLDARRRSWQKVYDFAPQDNEAAEGLNRVQKDEREAELRRQLHKLRYPLIRAEKDLREVDEARRKAEQLLSREVFSDPELHRQADETRKELIELRDKILRASAGGASSERAKDFEKALTIYEDALDNCYVVIQDDVTGEPIQVQEALRRTRKAYWQDLKERAMRRHEEAKASLEEGYPETAVSRLEDAYGLTMRIKEGGEDIRRLISSALLQAREALKNKERAQRLVAEAEVERDLEKARANLKRAQHLYPKYPNIGRLIQEKERIILSRLVDEARHDIAEARTALVRGWAFSEETKACEEFAEARELCRRAARRGAHLSITSRQWEKKQQEIDRLLRKINNRQEAWQAMLNDLCRLDQAISEKDVRLANTLLTDLEAWSDDKRVMLRREQLILLQGDEEKLVEAERLFFEERDYEATLHLCNSDDLRASPFFRDQARELKRRAQARLWLERAQRSYRTGDFDEALEDFRRVEALLSRLPEEDRSLWEEACEQRRRIEKEIVERTGDG